MPNETTIEWTREKGQSDGVTATGLYVAVCSADPRGWWAFVDLEPREWFPTRRGAKSYLEQVAKAEAR